jgi:hypothetical protein
VAQPARQDAAEQLETLTDSSSDAERDFTTLEPGTEGVQFRDKLID